MPNHDIVVIGASAGGVEALSRLVGHLPSDLEAALFIASHNAPYSPSLLPAILSRAGPLPAAHAVHGEAIRRGRVYVAPPDHHMLLEDHRVRLTRGPKENRFRPAVDPLFRSAAYSHGPRVVGVVLTGALDDGTAGLWAIKDRGGKVIVQDPAEARHPSMPLSALQHVEVDHKLPVAEIAGMLVRLSSEPAADEVAYPISDQLEIETRIASESQALRAGALKLGNFSPFTCPECHGALMQIKDSSLMRYRCHTGHAYSVDSLLATLAETSEDALWNALRSIEESLILLAHLGEHAQEANRTTLAASFKARAQEAQARVDAIRRVIAEGGSSQPVLEEISQTRKRA